MKTTITSIGIIAMLFATLQSLAQKQKDNKKFSGGFGIETGYVTGNVDFKEIFIAEFGLSARFALKVGPGWITLTPGYTVLLPKNFEEDDVISVGSRFFVKGGYKYIFLKRLFVMGEVGYCASTIYTEDDETADGFRKDNAGGVCFAPTIGGNFGRFELGLKYEIANLSNFDTKAAIVGLRFGFNF